MFEENAELWALGIPGRDTIENELETVPEELKKNLSAEGLNKFMHAGVLAYASMCYLLDVIDELKHVEVSKAREELRTLAYSCVVQDLNFGADIETFEDEESEGWARRIARDFDALADEIQS